MPPPTEERWLEIAAGFEANADFPNCVRALDGKNIRVKKTPCSGSRFYNYKGYFSVVLMAVADSDYRFVLVDIGSYGSSTDARIFKTSRMGQQLQSEELSLPEPRTLPGSRGPPAPYVIVGDEGFGLTKNVMRPFARLGLDRRHRIFNYHLTRAQRYMDALQLGREKVTAVVKACVVLHNFSRIHDGETVLVEDVPQQPLCTHHEAGSPPGRGDISGLPVRDQFADYFIGPEAVSWQEHMIHG
ncbi:DDE superfamily endonuclease, partial [Pristimantis euphronides]